MSETIDVSVLGVCARCDCRFQPDDALVIENGIRFHARASVCVRALRVKNAQLTAALVQADIDAEKAEARMSARIRELENAHVSGSLQAAG